MKPPILVFVLLLPFNILFAADERLTITTYYPSPYGVHRTVQLYPRPRPAEPCRTGEMVYHDGSSNIAAAYYTCNATSNWTPLGSGGSSYWNISSWDPNTITNINPGKVIVGPGSPLTRGKLTVAKNCTATWTKNPPVVWGTSTDVYGILDDYGWIEAAPGKALALGAGNIPYQVVFNNTTGNMAIGAMEPQARLHVHGNLLIEYDPAFSGSATPLEIDLNCFPNIRPIMQITKQYNAARTIWDGYWSSGYGILVNHCNALYEYVFAYISNPSPATKVFYQLGYAKPVWPPSPQPATETPLLNITGGMDADQGCTGIGNPINPLSFKLQVAGNIGPAADQTYDLGSATKPWNNVYCFNLQQISDGRLKTNITDTPLGLDFVMRLRPVQFNWKEHDIGTHQGIIAQELEKVIKDRSIEFAGLNHDLKSDLYSVSYTELIPPMIKAVQEQQKEIEDLQTKIGKLRKSGAGGS